MVALRFLSGQAVGRTCIARRFPFRLGRSPASDLSIEAEGVWQDHLRIDFERADGFALVAAPDALALVNGAPAQRARLRNGDVIELGAVKIRFELAPAQQAGLAFREMSIWLMIAALMAAQGVLLVWLMR